jgi:hypothetical protein
VELGEGEASLHFTDVAVNDWISVFNSLSMGTQIPGTPLPATMSLDVEWSGRRKRLGVFRSESLGFVDDLIEVETVTVAVSTVQATAAPGATGQSFTFTSDPTTFVSKFSVVGRERNGVFARNSERREGG